jgi:hypothetical protein
MLSGTQTQQVGKAVMENTIQGNTLGNMPWISGLQDYYQEFLRYAVNQARINIATYGDEFEDIVELGNGDAAMVKATKEMAFEDIGLWFDFENVMDKQAELTLFTLAQGWSNAGLVSPPAMMALLREKTFTGKENVLETDMAKMREEKIRAEEAAAATNQYNQEQQTQRTKLAVDTQADTTQRSVDGKITETNIKEQGMNRRKAAELLAEQQNNNDNSKTE